jgi:hypothetical protein
MPDISSYIRDKSDRPEAAENSEDVVTWATHNVLDPAINAGPLGVYNAVANVAHLPEYKLPVDQADPYTDKWFVQSLSSGVGASVPFMLAAAGTGKVFRSANAALAGTAMGETLAPVLTSKVAASVAGAALYGAMEKPQGDHTRFGNAMGMGIGFMVFNQGNLMARELPLAGKLLAYPATGFAGGAVMSEASSLFSNGHFASGDHVMQSAVQGMTMNSVMPLAQEGIRRATEKPTPGASRSGGERAPEGQPEPNQAGGPLDNLQVRRDGIAGLNNRSLKLSALSTEYSDWLKQNTRSYPEPGDFSKLTPEEIVQRGFLHPDAKPIEIETFDSHGKKPPPLPDAKVVASEVQKATAGMPVAAQTGDLIIGEWNMEFLTGDKANYFKDSYGHIVPKHHLMFVEEANAEGLAQVAKDNGYHFEISRDNSRGQAVGFLVNNRLKVLGTQSYESVANVDNIPDLRPAFRVDLQDTATGQKFSAVTVHLKSMRGGPEQTAPVRTEQAARLAADLGPKFSGVVAGDWNTFLDKTHELDPLIKAGFEIVNPGDHSSTQAMGGRLDGFLIKDMPGKMTNPEARPFFQNPLITRGLSDHALLTTHLQLNPSHAVMWAPVTRMLQAFNAGR